MKLNEIVADFRLKVHSSEYEFHLKYMTTGEHGHYIDEVTKEFIAKLKQWAIGCIFEETSIGLEGITFKKMRPNIIETISNN